MGSRVRQSLWSPSGATDSRRGEHARAGLLAVAQEARCPLTPVRPFCLACGAPSIPVPCVPTARRFQRLRRGPQSGSPDGPFGDRASKLWVLRRRTRGEDRVPRIRAAGRFAALIRAPTNRIQSAAISDALAIIPRHPVGSVLVLTSREKEGRNHGTPDANPPNVWAKRPGGRAQRVSQLEET